MARRAQFSTTSRREPEILRISFEADFNPLNAKLNPICHLMALLGAHHILHVSRVRVNRTYITGN
jgi:hypothetical protein